MPVISENPKQLPSLTFLSYDCTLDQYMSNHAGALWEVAPCDLSFPHSIAFSGNGLLHS